MTSILLILESNVQVTLKSNQMISITINQYLHNFQTQVNILNIYKTKEIMIVTNIMVLNFIICCK